MILSSLSPIGSISYILVSARDVRLSVPARIRLVEVPGPLKLYWGVVFVGLLVDFRKLRVERAKDHTKGALVTQTPIEASRRYQNW